MNSNCVPSQYGDKVYVDDDRLSAYTVDSDVFFGCMSDFALSRVHQDWNNKAEQFIFESNYLS